MYEKLQEYAGLVIVFLVSLLVMSTNIADPDLWGHVQYGRDWIRDGALATTNTYSFTAEGFRWINHENLAELAMAWVVDQVGPGGLIVMRALFAAAIIGTILLYNLRSGFGFFVSCAVTVLVAWNLGFHFSYRPQVATMAGFTAMMLVIQVAFQGWRDRWHAPLIPGARNWIGQDKSSDASLGRKLGYVSWAGRMLWLVPLIICVWANTHGGFLAGLAIYVAYLGLRAVEAMLVRRQLCWGMVRRLSLMAAAAIAASLLTPYSWNLIGWMLYDVGNPRPEISDWSAWHLLTVTGAKFWVLLGIVIFSVAFSKRQKDFTQLVIWSLIIWQSVTHFRHIQFFAILCGFWLAPHLASALQQFGALSPTPDRALSKPPRVRAWQSGAAGIMAAILVIGLIPRLRDIRVDRQAYPVDAIQYMADKQVTGKSVVTFDWAQYYIAAMCAQESPVGPASTVAMDGRLRTCYPQEIIDLHFDFLFGEGEGIPRFRSSNSPPCDPTRVLRSGSPEIVLNRRYNEVTETVMRQQSGEWTLLYQDCIAQVWGRTDLFGRPESPSYISPENRCIDQITPAGYARWPALPVVSPNPFSIPKTANTSQLELPPLSN